MVDAPGIPDQMHDRRAARRSRPPRSEASRFVGRADECREFRAALDDARAANGSIVLIGGEAGMGKSRLTLELARAARASHCTVLLGRCRETDGVPSYWPWIEALRALLAQTGDARFLGALRGCARSLASILPEILDVVPDVEPDPIADSAVARFQLFDGVARMLREAARRAPVVVALEDVHRADAPSLQLLRFVAAGVADARLVVLVTYRDTDVPAGTPAGEAIAALGAQPGARHLRLRPLGEEHVAELIAITTGRPPSPERVERIVAITEGNPLFVCEMARLLAGETSTPRDRDEWSRLPAAVEEVIGRRLDRLAEPCRAVLTAAAVIGREFTPAQLGQVARMARDRLHALLSGAARAHVAEPIGDPAGSYRFTHALIRAVLYQRLTPRERAALHERVGRVIEATSPGSAADVSSLAHHFHEAARVTGNVARALAYAERAAQRSFAALAYEDAADLYRRVLELLDVSSAPDGSVRRCRARIGLAEAERRIGRIGEANRLASRAAEEAAGMGEPDLLGRAALAYDGVGFLYFHDAFGIALLERALRAVPLRDGVLRARLLARLAECLPPNECDRRAALGEEAVAIARRLGDAAALAGALVSWQAAAWTPDNLEQRSTIAGESLALAGRCDDEELVGRARHMLVVDLLEGGQAQRAYAEMALQTAAGEALRHPLLRWNALLYATLRATLEGRFGEAERLADEGLAVGRGVSPDVELTHVSQLFQIRRHQGRLGEVLEGALRLSNQQPTSGHLRAGVALCCLSAGRDAEARGILERLATNDFAELARDSLWLACMTVLAEVCVVLRDQAIAPRIYAALAPFADRIAIFGMAGGCTGSTHLSLGLLASLLERWSAAAGHFAAALRQNQKIGAAAWVATTELGYARMLHDRGDPADAPRVRLLATRAGEAARLFGMDGVARAAARLLDALGRRSADRGARGPEPVKLAGSRESQAVYRREGEYWTVAFGGVSCRLKSSVGLENLSVLLRNPGRAILALELVMLRGGDAVRGELRVSTEVLDAKARSAYRGRVEELREELEDAETCNDVARAANARIELDRLSSTLARAIGLGGRVRAMPSPHERARVNVTRTIKDALRRIDRHIPTLGDHLAATVRTGTFCVYRPDPRAPIVWQS